MPRGPRLDSPGTLHHVMLRGIDKTDIVLEDTDRKDFVSRLGEVSKKTETAIYAWALLNNHAHILLRSGRPGLSTFARQFLSGYAGTFNRRHKRSGHLFQNRYKSIVCQEDAYFTELIRYIHLNPIRAGLVNTLSSLDKYQWCGHATIMGKRKNDWQDSDYVLSCFGKNTKASKKAYHSFMKEGVNQGQRPELSGGGLIRSQGGWSVVKSKRKNREKALGDPRILGDSKFVKKILSDASGAVTSQFGSVNKQIAKASKKIKEECAKNNISPATLLSGSRERNVSTTRKRLALILVKDLGLSLAETARQLGVTTSAVALILRREKVK